MPEQLHHPAALELKVFGSFGVNVMALEAFSADVFGWKAADAMLPLTGVLSVQRADGRIVGFRVDTPRTRHVWFERSAAAAPKGQS